MRDAAAAAALGQAIRASITDAGLTVRVTPRANRAAITMDDDGQIHVRVTVPPEDGKANAAVASLVADALGVAKSRVTVVAGHKARIKRLRIDD